MDFEGEPGVADGVWPGYHGPYEAPPWEDFMDVMFAPGYGSWDEDEAQNELSVGIARVPLTLLRSTANKLQDCESLLRAWMFAVAVKFPDTSLGELRSKCPSLLPLWLLQRFATYEDLLVLRHGGIFAVRPGTPKERAFSSESLSVLAATSECRFRESFASEGMLCNNPPIPLRVLDFLEDTEDLLNLAVVCKATHQAGHVLLQREFPGGVAPGLPTHDELSEAIKKRKRIALDSMLRQAVTSNMAPASTMAAAAGMHAAACIGAHAGDAGFVYEARTSAEADEADQVYEDIVLPPLLLDEPPWDELDLCMLTLLWAWRGPAAGPSGFEGPHPSLEWLLDSDIADDWVWLLQERLRDGIVMHPEAVRRATAHWADLDVQDPDWSGGRCDVTDIMSVVRAAERHGQGVIVHPWCFLSS